MSKPNDMSSASIQNFMSIQPALKKAKANPIRDDDYHKQGAKPVRDDNYKSSNPIRDDDFHKQGAEAEPQPFMPRNQ